MAVSGHKDSDFHGSTSKHSAKDFDHNCEPCLTTGQHAEASRSDCVECQECMCKNCFSYHQRTKASMHHQLLDKDEMDKQTIPSIDSTVCIEKCHTHRSEAIKNFCTNHEFLGCTDCITLDHRACKIEYIPDKCEGIGDSEEYREIIRELDQKIEDMAAVIKKATLQDKELDFTHDHAIKEIANFRKEINDHLDQLQTHIQEEADKRKFTGKQMLKEVLETCNALSSDIKKFKFSLQDSKSSKQNEQLYIMIKQAKAKLKLNDAKTAQESLQQTSIQYTFERNKELENLLTKQDICGKLILPTTLVTPRKQQKVSDKLTHKGDINIRTESDQNKCLTSGCSVLSSHKIVLTDYYNSKLKVVDTQNKVVTEEMTLDSNPWDIAVLPQDRIAVTLPDKREILLITTAGKLSLVNRIPVECRCRGITYNQGQLYTACYNPHSVCTVDTQGNVNKIISLNEDIIITPNFILLSEDARHIYISDYGSESVVSITLQGDISAVYKHKDLRGPTGMEMLDDGSLLVCCCKNRTIHCISGDLKQGQKMVDGLQYPQSICYNYYEQEIYTGGQCDQLKIIK